MCISCQLARIWSRDAVVDQDITISLLWIPGRTDIAGDTAARKQAGEPRGVKCPESRVPVDLCRARNARKRPSLERQGDGGHHHAVPSSTHDVHTELADSPPEVNTLNLQLAFDETTLHRLDLALDPLN